MSSSCVTQRYGQGSKAEGCSSRYVAQHVTERSVRGAVRQVRTDIPSPGDPGVSELKLPSASSALSSCPAQVMHWRMQ